MISCLFKRLLFNNGYQVVNLTYHATDFRSVFSFYNLRDFVQTQ